MKNWLKKTWRLFTSSFLISAALAAGGTYLYSPPLADVVEPLGGETLTITRSYNGEKHYLGGNQYRILVASKQVNYLAQDGKFHPIITEPTWNGTQWVVASSTQEVTFPARSDGDATLNNNDRYDTETGRTITTTPQTVAITAEGVASVTGVKEYGNTGRGNSWYVRYPDAYASGADLIYRVWHAGKPSMEKLARFDSAPASDVELPYVYEFSTDPAFGAWNKKRPYEIPAGYSVPVQYTDAPRSVQIEPMEVWDSNTTTPKVARIKATIEKVATNTYRITKHIPASYFTGVTYPVYTDATISSLYATVDNNCQSFHTSTWSTARQATDADSGGCSAVTSDYWQAENDAGDDIRIKRYFVAMDTGTAGLPACASVSAATYYQFHGASYTGSQYLNILQSNHATWNDPVSADFDQCGESASLGFGAAAVAATDFIEGSTRDNTYTDNAYNGWALNATGTTWLAGVGETKPAGASASGKSQFCFRWNWDLDNTDPHGLGRSYRLFRHLPYSGTSSDPYLDITYTDVGCPTPTPTPGSTQSTHYTIDID